MRRTVGLRRGRIIEIKDCSSHIIHLLFKVYTVIITDRPPERNIKILPVRQLPWLSSWKAGRYRASIKQQP